MKLIILISTLFFLNRNSFASLLFNSYCKAAYLSIIDLDSAKANYYIKQEIKANPSNQFVVFLENYVEFVEVFFSENQKDYRKYKQNFSEKIKKILEEDSNTPLFNYCLAEMFLHSSLLKMQFNEKLTGFYDLHQSFKYLEENEKIFPHFLPNKKTLNLIRAIWSSIPNEYQKISNLIGLKGSINQSVAELSQLVKSCEQDTNFTFLYTEAYLTLTFVKTKLASGIPNKIYFQQCREKKFHQQKAQKNVLLNISDAFQFVYEAKNDSALQRFKNAKGLLAQKVSIPQLNYYIGLCLLRKMDTTANYYFFTFLNNFDGINLVKSANLRLAWYYSIFKSTIKEDSFIKQVRSSGNVWINEDGQSFKEINDAINVPLLKSRLLFDGGYYFKSLQILANVDLNKDLKTLKDKIEYSYRLARIYQQLEDFDKAIPLFKKVMEIGEGLPYYFSANSALQLGYIYQQKNNHKEAKCFLKKCLDISCKEEENNIHSNAKEALKLITE